MVYLIHGAVRPWRPRRALLLLVLAGTAACGDSPPAGPWNLVLITLDTTRADRLGCYGYFRDTSPELDRLARESILFERCFAPVSATFPSHLSLLTGADPREHGSPGNVGDGGSRFVSGEGLRSLTELLAGAGYTTAGFVSATPLKKYTGIHAGFDVYDMPPRAQRPAADTNAHVIAWLEEERDPPFFLWVHYFDPHTPYAPPEPFASRYLSDRDQSAYLAERAVDTSAEIRFQDTADLTVTEANNLYDGEVCYLDQQLGHVLDWFRSRRDVWRRTIVVVVGDHGEGLGQHGMMTHGGVWSEQLRVPLIIRVPGRKGRRVERLVSVTDVFPTLFGLVDIPGEAAFLRQASGVDRLAPAPDDVVFCQEAGFDFIRRQRRPEDLRSMIIGDGWKYVHDPLGEDRLYRLDADPHELASVHERHPDVIIEMRQRVLDRIAAQRIRRRAIASPDSTPEPLVEPETMEQLRALGYAD